jgi:hypothetical protein
LCYPVSIAPYSRSIHHPRCPNNCLGRIHSFRSYFQTAGKKKREKEKEMKKA